MDLISALPVGVIALSFSMTDGTTDPDMNKYADEMDSSFDQTSSLLLLLISMRKIPYRSHFHDIPIPISLFTTAFVLPHITHSWLSRQSGFAIAIAAISGSTASSALTVPFLFAANALSQSHLSCIGKTPGALPARTS